MDILQNQSMLIILENLDRIWEDKADKMKGKYV